MNISRFTILLACAATFGLAQDGKTRVYVTDSQSWSVGGGFGAANAAGGGAFSGGARPQTAEIMKTFDQRRECQGLTITRKEERADFVVVLDHEGGKNIVRRDNKVVVFNKDGDLIHSESTRSLGNAVKNACRAIYGDG
jgi:hypothetical protein